MSWKLMMVRSKCPSQHVLKATSEMKLERLNEIIMTSHDMTWNKTVSRFHHEDKQLDDTCFYKMKLAMMVAWVQTRHAQTWMNSTHRTWSSWYSANSSKTMESATPHFVPSQTRGWRRGALLIQPFYLLVCSSTFCTGCKPRCSDAGGVPFTTLDFQT